MAITTLGVSLAILRLVRGWNQEELARASGIAQSSLSEYERGRKVPELATLLRLLEAMDYPLGAVDVTQGFMANLRSGAMLSGLGTAFAGPVGRRLGAQAEDDRLSPEREPSALLQWEIEQVSTEAGRATARLTRLVLLLMSGELAVTGSSRGLDPASPHDEPSCQAGP